jgi:signal transduction histidine kinase
VRWFAVGFAVLQFSTFTPSDGAGPLPFPRLGPMLAFVAVLVATNLVSRWVSDHPDPDLRRRVGYAEALVDTLLVVIVLWMFGFDPDVRLWPLLTFPVLEGAMRAELPGALGIWLLGTAAYGLEQLARGPGRGETLATIIPSITFAAGILLFVAIGMGFLARRLAVADAQTRQEKARLRRLAEVSRHVTAGTDADTVAHRFVEASCELTGYEHGSLMEYHGGDRWTQRAGVGIGVPDPPDGAWHIPEYTSLAERLDGPSELEVRGRLGALLRNAVPDVRRVVVLPVSREGRTLGLLFLGTSHDEVTLGDDQRTVLELLAGHGAVAIENAQVAAAREDTIAELEHLDEVKDDFLAILTHELRSPMTSMAGYADLLVERWDQVEPDRREQFLRSISSNTRRLAQLIEDVYDALRAERTELSVSREPVALEPIVRDAAARHVSPSERHRLVLELDEDVPHAWADVDRVTQVVDNLLSNAIKYSPEGGEIRVVVSRTGDRVRIEVSDEGLGIPEREQDRLFGKFARLHPGGDIRGTGLGLYLSRQLVHAMGGSIRAVSEEGIGSTFEVLLPAAADDERGPTHG